MMGSGWTDDSFFLMDFPVCHFGIPKRDVGNRVTSSIKKAHLVALWRTGTFIKGFRWTGWPIFKRTHGLGNSQGVTTQPDAYFCSIVSSPGLLHPLSGTHLGTKPTLHMLYCLHFLRGVECCHAFRPARVLCLRLHLPFIITAGTLFGNAITQIWRCSLPKPLSLHGLIVPPWWSLHLQGASHW